MNRFHQTLVKIQSLSTRDQRWLYRRLGVCPSILLEKKLSHPVAPPAWTDLLACEPPMLIACVLLGIQAEWENIFLDKQEHAAAIRQCMQQSPKAATCQLIADIWQRHNASVTTEIKNG